MFPVRRIQSKGIFYSFLIITIIYFWRSANKKAKLYYTKSEKNQSLLTKCPTILKKIFLPTLYLQHAVLQSLFASILAPRKQDHIYTIEEVNMEEGGHTSIAWVDSSRHPIKSDILVLIIPGITGSADENYVKDLVGALREANYRCAVYHTRFNSQRLVLPNVGYVDIIKDLKRTIEYIRQKEGGIKLFGIGHSYGANLLINYLGDNPNSGFIGAVSLANPSNFILGESKARRSIVNSKIADCLKSIVVRSKSELITAERFKLNVEELLSFKKVREIDKHFTIRLYGYETVEEYYWEMSSCRKLRFINVPVFMLQAEDDPIFDANSFVEGEIEKHCENVIVMLTPNGGHQGWIEGFFSLKRWYLKPTIEFADAVIGSDGRQ